MGTECNNFDNIEEIMNRIKTMTLLLSGVLILMSGCEKDDIMTYSVENSGIHFSSSLNAFSFYDMQDSATYTASVPVTMMGPSASYDRTFSANVDTAVTTAPQGQYEILGGVVKAGALTGKLYVKLYNAEALSTTTYKLGLKLEPGKDFQLGLPDKDSTLISWDNSLPRPGWWMYRSFGKYVSYITVNGSKKTAVYSTKLYEIMIKVWGSRNINAYGFMGTTSDVTDVYPLVYPGLPIFSVMIRQLEKYVYDYNQAHPDAPLRHSADAAIYTAAGAVTATYPNAPLIQINPYNQ